MEMLSFYLFVGFAGHFVEYFVGTVQLVRLATLQGTPWQLHFRHVGHRQQLGLITHEYC